MNNERWGNLKTMSREDLLLTKADIEANMLRIRLLLERDGDKAKTGTHHAMHMIKGEYTRVNVYLGVAAAREKRAVNLHTRFYELAKQELQPEIFQSLKIRAKATATFKGEE